MTHKPDNKGVDVTNMERDIRERVRAGGTPWFVRMFRLVAIILAGCAWVNPPTITTTSKSKERVTVLIMCQENLGTEKGWVVTFSSAFDVKAWQPVHIEMPSRGKRREFRCWFHRGGERARIEVEN